MTNPSDHLKKSKKLTSEQIAELKSRMPERIWTAPNGESFFIGIGGISFEEVGLTPYLREDLAQTRTPCWKKCAEENPPINTPLLCAYTANDDMAVLAFREGEWRDCAEEIYHGPDFWMPLPTHPNKSS